MRLGELLNKRLVFIGGKGGVGKTSVAVLVGLAAAKLKKKTLLVEMNSMGRIAPLFDAGPTPDCETALAPFFSAVNLRPKNCFEEYVLMHVRFKSIYEIFFNNKFVTNFLSAVPGLNEILMLGKIFDLERQTHKDAASEKLYDLILVDMPASGHGLSALEVPHVLMRAVKIGPMHANAEKMTRLFIDPEKTALSLVTLAEEMPVTETIEFARAITQKTGMALGPLFINAVMPMPPKIKPHDKLSETLSVYGDYYELAVNRAALNRDYMETLAKELKELERIILPFQHHGLNSRKDFGTLVEFVTGELT